NGHPHVVAIAQSVKYQHHVVEELRIHRVYRRTVHSDQGDVVLHFAAYGLCVHSPGILLQAKTLPWNILPIPWLTHVFALTHDRLAAQQYLIGAATYPHALVHVVVDVHQMGAGGDLELALGVEDHQIPIAANSDGTLAWKQPKNFGRLCGNEIDKLIVVDASTVHASIIDQRQAVFDPWATVGDFREIVLAEGFLVGEAERAVVCRYDRDITGAPPPP